MKRPLKVHQGQILRHRGPLELCKRGLHASVMPLDALKYAPGSVVCRVECSGEVIHGEDKLVCSRRRVLWMADASRSFREFTIWCTERAPEEVENPDPRSLRALEAKINGKTVDEELKEARLAVWYVAWLAARDAARAAAKTADRAAAKAAAQDVAKVAARDAAQKAAWRAAWDAQNEELERKLLALQPH